MKRWEGQQDRPRPKGADFIPSDRVAPAAPAAQDPSPLQASDVVVVWMDPWTRRKREGIAVLVKPRALLTGPRPPLEYWDVRLMVAENAYGQGYPVPKTIQLCSRLVQRADRTALAADVLATSQGAKAARIEQGSFLEDDTERARR